jgi:hypothetical protein
MRLSTIAHHVMPFVALVGGILVLFMPRVLNYVVVAYLILVGIIARAGSGNLHRTIKWNFCLTADTLCPANQERP